MTATLMPNNILGGSDLAILALADDYYITSCHPHWEGWGRGRVQRANLQSSVSMLARHKEAFLDLPLDYILLFCLHGDAHTTHKGQ